MLLMYQKEYRPNGIFWSLHL